mgnify:CR=1 FL=1
MQSNEEKSHVVTCDDFEPSIDRAITETLKMDWVGLVDFYHESVCLLVSRLNRTSAYMDTCGCEEGGQNSLPAALTVDVHDDHMQSGVTIPQYEMDMVTTVSSRWLLLFTHLQRAALAGDMLQLMPTLQAKVDRMTFVDRTLFEVSCVIMKS